MDSIVVVLPKQRAANLDFAVASDEREAARAAALLFFFKKKTLVISQQLCSELKLLLPSR